MEISVKGTFENSEILLKHSELIIANLEKIEHEFRDDGKILSKVKGNNHSQFKKFVNEYEQAIQRNEKLPTASGSISSSIESVANDLISTKSIFVIDYACFWLKSAQRQLQLIDENSHGYDIRWNLPFTLRTIKIFVAFCKISLLLYYIKNSSVLISAFCASNFGKGQKLLNPINDLATIVKSCNENPFSYIASQNENLKTKFSATILEILPFFSPLFSDWPVVNWSLLSFYESSPDDMSGNSLPINELILLANISLFYEFMTFFLMVYPESIDQNTQLTPLASAVMSETAFFYISRNYFIKSSELINLSLSIPANKSNKALPMIRDNFEKSIETKNKSAHLQRMQQLYYLAEDIESFSEIDFNQFLQCTPQVIAICAFSYYEIEMFFRMKDQKLWDQIHVTTVMKLFGLLDKITELFVREKYTIERFYIYNLSTSDADYLQGLIDQIGPQQGGNFVKAAGYIKTAIQSVDLKEFEQGIHYDFYPLLLTEGRLLHDFNKLPSNLTLNPLFEHLTSIGDHCCIAMDSMRYFLEFCPIHTLWRHHAIFSLFLKSEFLPMNTSIAFLHVFSYFNYDDVILPSMNMIEPLKTQLQSVKAILSQQIRALMGKIISKKKETEGTKEQKEFETNPNFHMLNTEHVNMKTEYINALTQANQFVVSIPESIFFYGNTIDIASFFINSIQNDFIRVLLFRLHDNTHAIVDAAEFLWSLMGKIGIDFRQALFNGITKETMFASPDIKQQAKCFIDPSLSKCPQGMIDEQRIVHKFALELIEFITQGHKKTKYVQFTQQFFALTKQEMKLREDLVNKPKGVEISSPGGSHSNVPGSPGSVSSSQKESTGTMGMGFGFGNELDGSLCFSTHHFADLFRTLGLHCALYLDCTLFMSTLNSLFNVVEEGYSNFSKLLGNNQTLTDNIINSPEIAKATESLLSVAVGLTVQNMIRRGASIIVDETIPGLARTISSHLESQPNMADDLMTIKEITSSDNSFYFIKQFLNGASKCSADLKNYFMYIAAMILNINWNGVQFYPDDDALWQNYHLIPYAFELLIDVAPLLFEKAAPENIRAGIDTFFLTLSSFQPKMNKGQKFNPFYILVDKFMKFVPGLDYAEMENYFPYSLLSSGYPSTTSI